VPSFFVGSPRELLRQPGSASRERTGTIDGSHRPRQSATVHVVTPGLFDKTRWLDLLSIAHRLTGQTPDEYVTGYK
jgi:hypothetical protein